MVCAPSAGAGSAASAEPQAASTTAAAASAETAPSGLVTDMGVSTGVCVPARGHAEAARRRRLTSAPRRGERTVESFRPRYGKANLT
ncbi:hypothetical protein GCM10027212_31100 [Actinotalea caeni]